MKVKRELSFGDEQLYTLNNSSVDCEECVQWKQKFDTLSKENDVLNKRIQQLEARETTTEADKEDNIFEIEKLLSHKFKGKDQQLYYLIRWKGTDKSEDSWIPECNLQCPSILKRYKKRNHLI